MKRIDFENGTVTGNIIGAALPMLVAQILNLLYNIVDRIYIARIPEVGTAALGAVGLCFPLIVIISAFANLFGSGGAPLFSIFRGKKEEQQAAADIKTITYTIQRGDTLTSICQKQYGTISRINEICQLNGISPEDIIYAGGKLLLPES